MKNRFGVAKRAGRSARATVLLVGALAFAQEKPATDPPKGSIAGTVRESVAGAPLKDVEIFVNRNSLQAGHAVTDQNGHYVVHDVVPGQVRISANAPDSSGRTGFGPNASRQISLAPGQDLTGIDFRLVIAGQITGKVLDQNKEPVVGLSVFLVVREYTYGALRSIFAGATQTDDQGEYRLERVQPGRAYAVLATKRWRTLAPISDSPVDPALRLPAVAPTYHPNAASLDGAEMLVLRPGERREGVDIRMTRSPAFCLDGVLEGPSGMRFGIAETQPASGQSGNGGFYTGSPGGIAGPDGKLRICDLHPGDYELTVNEFGRPGSFTTSGFGQILVTIGDRDVTGVRVSLRGKTPVSGEVVFDGPEPATPITAKLALNVTAITRTERGNAQSEIPGEFTFTDGLLSDEYGLDISRVPAELYVKDVTYGGRSILYETMRVGSVAPDAKLKVVLARDGGTASVRVADKDGNPVSDCSVVIMPDGAPDEAAFSRMFKTGKTLQTGMYTSPTLAPGKYFARATTGTVDHSPETVGKLWKARMRAQEVVIAPNGQVSVTLAPTPLE